MASDRTCVRVGHWPAWSCGNWCERCSRRLRGSTWPENPPASGKLPPELDAEDVADIPSQDLRLDGDEKRRYLLAGPRPDEKAPKSGFGLIVVMPGGTGDATFHPFVKRIYKNAVPDGFLVVQPVAPKWTEKQFVVWPTNKVKADGMKFSCDDFVEDVVAAIAKTQKIDPERVYTLSWSSSGPLAYLLSMRKGGAVRGSFIAMSVFHENEYDVELAKGQRYYLYHSAEDETCPFAQAEEARDDSGGRIEAVTDSGAPRAEQHHGDADGDEHGRENGFAEHGPHDEALDREAEDDGCDDGAGDDDEHVAGERGGDGPGDIGHDHRDLALGEIHQPGRLVDDREAHGDEAVDCADGYAGRENVREKLHASPP